MKHLREGKRRGRDGPLLNIAGIQSIGLSVCEEGAQPEFRKKKTMDKLFGNPTALPGNSSDYPA
jgi:hypothetical protein